jgi:hypothetical protein
MALMIKRLADREVSLPSNAGWSLDVRFARHGHGIVAPDSMPLFNTPPPAAPDNGAIARGYLTDGVDQGAASGER